MKRILFILCLLITLLTATNAAAFQKCVDKDGNVIFTDNPPLGAKCESSEGEDEATLEESDSAGKQQGEMKSDQTKQKDKLSDQQAEMNRLKKIPRVSY